MVLSIASFVSGIGFLIYGVQCLRDPFMKREFERFKVPQFRTLTGVLEIIGGVGVLAGLVISFLGILASAGLAVLMLLGVITRIKVGDSPSQCLPASFFCTLNAVILFLHLRGF